MLKKNLMCRLLQNNTLFYRENARKIIFLSWNVSLMYFEVTVGAIKTRDVSDATTGWHNRRVK